MDRSRSPSCLAGTGPPVVPRLHPVQSLQVEKGHLKSAVAASSGEETLKVGLQGQDSWEKEGSTYPGP